MHLMHPILIFTMGQVRQQNGVKPSKTRVLEEKYGVRNQRDIVEHRNGVIRLENRTLITSRDIRNNRNVPKPINLGLCRS